MDLKLTDSASDEMRKDGSATQTAYATIRQLILTGDLLPGQKLKIDTLRETIGTGASPIREALSLLTSDMLVERYDQRGFRAAPTSGANFEEILSLRCALEEMALRSSLASATPEWEEELVVMHHRMTRSQTEHSDAFEMHHKAFHMALLANCGSPILLAFCSKLYDLNIRYRYIAARSAGYKRRDVTAEHDDILSAATQGDTDLTSERLLGHYRLTGAYLNGLFDGMHSE